MSKEEQQRRLKTTWGKAKLSHSGVKPGNAQAVPGQEGSVMLRNNGKGYIPRLYQTSISPLRVLTSIMVCPKKSSDSFLKCCFTRDFISSSSSHTLTLILSVEL